MSNFLASLFNRAPRTPGISLSAKNDEKEKKARNPQADPLTSLDADMIETNFRLAVNRGLYATPAWAFHELARTCSLLGDKVRFWKAQLSALEWHIAVAKDAQDGAEGADAGRIALAEKQRAALHAHYERITNLKAAIKHMATARFFGYAALRKTDAVLQLVYPWNVVRDLQWQGETAPSMLWYWNQKARTNFNKAEMAEMKAGEYVVRECEDPSMLELMRLAFRANAVMNFREKNLEEASKNQVVILTGANMPASGTTEYTNLVVALTAARKGESAVIAKGDPACPTEVHKLDASKGLPFYTSTLQDIDQAMTKAVTGGMLTMLSMPTGIGAATANVQADTLKTLVADEAGDISEAFQMGIDRFVLEKEGLLQKGERPLAYFELSSRKEADPTAAAELLTQIKAAGFAVDPQQASEMLGMEVEAAPDPVSAFGGPANDINADPEADGGDDVEDLENREGFDPNQPRDEGGRWTTAMVASHLHKSGVPIARNFELDRDGKRITRSGVSVRKFGKRITIEAKEYADNGMKREEIMRMANEALASVGLSAKEYGKTGIHVVFRNPSFANRNRALSNAATARDLAAMDAPFFAMLDRLAAEMGGDSKPDAEWFAKLEREIRDAPPEALMDVAAMEEYLARTMAAAAKVGEAAAQAEKPVDAPAPEAQDKPMKNRRKSTAKPRKAKAAPAKE